MPTLAEINSPEYLDKLRRQAEGQLAPTRDIALNQIGLEEVGIGQQETDTKRQTDQLTRLLEENSVKSSRGLEERYNQLGLLQSGMTAAGLGDIQKDLFRGKQETEQDKASRLASLALQRSGLGLKRVETQQNYGSTVNDLVTRLLSQAREQATLDESVSPVDLGNRIAFVDRFGNIKRIEQKGSMSSGSGGMGSATSALLQQLLQSMGGQGTVPTAKQGSLPAGIAVDAQGSPVLDENYLRGLGTIDRVKYLRSLGFSNTEVTQIASQIF